MKNVGEKFSTSHSVYYAVMALIRYCCIRWDFVIFHGCAGGGLFSTGFNPLFHC